jgi:hypothetical protein
MGALCFEVEAKMEMDAILEYGVVRFPPSEIALPVFRRSPGRSWTPTDRQSLRLLWLTIITSLGLTVFLRWYPSGVFEAPRSIIHVIALCLLAGGMLIRRLAIKSLGELFTVDVAIQEHHLLMRNGGTARNSRGELAAGKKQRGMSLSWQDVSSTQRA